MFRFVCRKIGLFPAILHRKMFSASFQRVTLILLDFTPNNVSVYFRVSYAVFSVMFGGTAFTFFVLKLRR